MRSHMFNKIPYLWPVGRGGMVDPDRVVAVGLWSSAPIRRAARRAKADGHLIDLTYGRATKWVLFMDTDHLVLASEPMPVAMADLEEIPPWEE